MEKLVVHYVRMKPLNTGTNSVVQVGKPEDKNFVTSYNIENQGRNSLMKIGPAEGMPYVELRPGDPAFVMGVEWPSVLRHTLTITFEEENQQQYDADGTRPEVDPNETDPNELDALVHKGVLVENFVIYSEPCHISA